MDCSNTCNYLVYFCTMMSDYSLIYHAIFSFLVMIICCSFSILILKQRLDKKLENIKVEMELDIKSIKKDIESNENNLSSIRLDTDALIQMTINDISVTTIPRDFERNKKIHRCWRIKPAV